MKPGFLLGLVLVVMTLMADVGPRVEADGPSSEAVVNATVRINPLSISLKVPHSPQSAGERFEVKATLRNAGDSRLRDLDAVLHVVEAPCLKVVRAPTRHRGLLRRHQQFTATWELQTLRNASCSSIVVVVSGSAIDEATGEVLTVESAASVITIRQHHR
jgi:hypothetical protein